MTRTPVQLLSNTLHSIRRAIYSLVFFSMCINFLMLAAPLYMLQIFDRVLSSRSVDTLVLLTIIIIFALLTLALLDAVRSNILVRVSTWIDRRLAGTVLTGSIATPLKLGTDPSVQGLRDLGICRSFISGAEIFSFLDAPWAPIFLVFVFLLHPLLGLVALLGAIVLFALAVLNEIVTRPMLTRAGESQINAMRQAESAVRNADVIEAMGMMPGLIARWDRDNAHSVAQQAEASFRSAMIVATTKFTRLTLQVAMLGTGAWLVIQGELTPGAMIAASILMARALAPVEQAIAAWKSAINARGAYARLEQNVKAMPSRAESMSLPPPEGRLSVQGVSYFHPGQTEPVLQNINFELPAGQALGLIGPSASGKSTLLRLLLGNLNPRLGQVRLDGMDVSRWNPDELGNYCGYLPQDVELFNGTVKDNIARLREPDADKVIAAAITAGCHDMILRLPSGYDTNIGESGMALSGGERQRIALARALYDKPRLVILDEPNSNLDATGEEALIKALKTLKEARVTVVIVGHRPAVVQTVDQLLVLSQGRVQDYGSREDILAKLAENARATSLAEVKRRG